MLFLEKQVYNISIKTKLHASSKSFTIFYSIPEKIGLSKGKIRGKFLMQSYLKAEPNHNGLIAFCKLFFKKSKTNIQIFYLNIF